MGLGLAAAGLVAIDAAVAGLGTDLPPAEVLAAEDEECPSGLGLAFAPPL